MTIRNIVLHTHQKLEKFKKNVGTFSLFEQCRVDTCSLHTFRRKKALKLKFICDIKQRRWHLDLTTYIYCTDARIHFRHDSFISLLEMLLGRAL